MSHPNLASSSPVLLHPALNPVDIEEQQFQIPRKCIHTHGDIEIFHRSIGYARIIAFLSHLNASVSPLTIQNRLCINTGSGFSKPDIAVKEVYTNSATVEVSREVQGVVDLLQALKELVEQSPPTTGPRRFGNVAFREWHRLALNQAPSLMERYLPRHILSANTRGSSPQDELLSYLIGSFGSPQRLDYGTGHELSFLAFICGIWLLRGLVPDRDEQAIVLRILPTYLDLVRTLVRTYTLEPAGSHGVWGLDDHFFLPYIFGSSQLTPEAPIPGQEPNYAQYGIPKPGDVTNKSIVNAWREKNLYFDAIGFIYDVKRGAFWEHSPILFDISGVREGWGKINMGMMKMYKAEVLGKFPVVQHFPFGSLFPWMVVGSIPQSETEPAQTEPAQRLSSNTPFLDMGAVATSRVITPRPIQRK